MQRKYSVPVGTVVTRQYENIKLGDYDLMKADDEVRSVLRFK